MIKWQCYLSWEAKNMHKAKRFINQIRVILMYLMVICEIVYLCVIQESDSSVT